MCGSLKRYSKRAGFLHFLLDYLITLALRFFLDYLVHLQPSYQGNLRIYTFRHSDVCVGVAEFQNVPPIEKRDVFHVKSNARRDMTHNFVKRIINNNFDGVLEPWVLPQEERMGK